jgi:hypothetical protein
MWHAVGGRPWVQHRQVEPRPRVNEVIERCVVGRLGLAVCGGLIHKVPVRAVPLLAMGDFSLNPAERARTIAGIDVADDVNARRPRCRDLLHLVGVRCRAKPAAGIDDHQMG